MILLLYLVVLLGFALYSFSQIDLNLTLFQSPVFLEFQKWAIQLGYFNRPVSTLIFVVLVIILTIFNLVLVILAQKNRISSKTAWTLILITFLFGLFSYPAFSHDIFNYIFDARLLVVHNANPYTSTALMFPFDDWTRFMNWTHRTYPYGPLWLVLTFPFYLLGLGKFVLTLFWFKFLMVISYVGCCYLVNKISGKVAMIFFATNPLIIIEAVNSSHLDVVMLFFALLAVYWLINQKKVLSYASLIVSVLIKFVTILFLPVFLLWNRININSRFKFLTLLAFVGALGQAGSRELLPHYFIVPIGIAALTVDKKIILWGTLALSFVLLVIRYCPFLWTGQWVPLKIIP